MKENETRLSTGGNFGSRSARVVPALYIMLVFAWLLCTLVGCIVAGPVQRAMWSEGSAWTEREGDLRPSFHRLPTFHHAPGPLVARELFQPIRQKRLLPAGLTALLIPPTRPPQGVQERGARAVEIWCGVDKISVRVDRFQLRAWTVPSLFRLGLCQPSKISARFLYFIYRLTECGGESKVVGGQLVYTYSLCYTAPPQEDVIRVIPLNFPINCHYNRFHYSYHVGFRPQVQHTTFLKSMRTKLSFSLTVCNAHWEPLRPGQWFFLGEQVYFKAQMGTLLAAEKLYVDSCHATSSKDPDSTPRLDIITNYGCMMDSRRESSSSQFLSRRSNVLKFSVDAFLFKEVSQMLYLHCSMSVGITTSLTSKSCNYNKAAGSWEELEAPPSICSCCDSVCSDADNSVTYTVSSPGWLIGQKDEEKQRLKQIYFPAEEGRDWLNQEVKSEERMGEHFEMVQQFQMKMEISHEEKNEEAIPEKNDWRHGTAVSWWGNKKENKMEEEIVEKADDQLKELADHNIMADLSRPQENQTVQVSKDVTSTKHDSVSGLSSDSSNTNPSEVGSVTTTVNTRNSSFGMDYDNPGNLGPDANVSTSVIRSKHCPDDDRNCSATSDSIKPESGSIHAGYSTIHTALSAGNFSPCNVSTTPCSNRSGSAWDSSIPESQFDGGLETFTRILSATSNLEFDPFGFDVRTLGKSRLESEKLDAFLRSEQLTSLDKSVNTKSDGIPQGAGDSVSSKGADGHEHMLHGLQIRGLKSDQTVYPPGFRGSNCVDWLLCESDFDSGNEGGEDLHLIQFTGAVMTNEEVQEVSDPITRRLSESFGSVSSEEMNQDNLIHSAVVAVASLQGSKGHPASDMEWAKVVPGWGLQIFRFVVEQPTQS